MEAIDTREWKNRLCVIAQGVKSDFLQTMAAIEPQHKKAKRGRSAIVSSATYFFS